MLSDPGCGVPQGQGSALGVPAGVAPDGSENTGLLPLCSSTTPEDPEVAFLLRLELKILPLFGEPRLLGDHDGRRKEAAFPALLSPHKSFVILLSPSLSLNLSLNLFPCDFFSDGKLFRTSKENMNPLHLSQDRNTHNMENSLKPMVPQMSFELTVNKTIKTGKRVVWGALTSGSDLS